MGYAVYDKKKKKFIFVENYDAYRTEKKAKEGIVGIISDAVNDEDMNTAIYYFENYIVKTAPLGFGKKEKLKEEMERKKAIEERKRPKPTAKRKAW